MIHQLLRLIVNRNFKKNKFHTFLNVAGLGVGLAAFILIMLFVQHERSYDRFHDNYKDLYRIVSDKFGDTYGGSPAQLAPYLEGRVPEIERYVRMHEKEDIMVYHGDELFFENDLLYADNDLFAVFSFPIIHGDKSTPLDGPNSLVITERMAEKYFKQEDPVGKTLMLFEDMQPFTIKAVAANPPESSTIAFNFIIPFEIMAEKSSWGMFNYTTYLLMDHKSKNAAEDKIQKLSVDRGDRITKLNFIRLQSLQDLRFEPVRGNDFPTIEKKYIFIYLSAAFFVLLLAAINYTNLASAISIKRSKEVALKKISGSSKHRIIMEILFESIVLSILALAFALIMVELLRPLFSQAIQGNLVFNYGKIPFYMVISLIVGIIAGLYPAFYSARFNIMGLLKESAYRGKKGGNLRNILVLIQFGITSFLLICALTFTKQLNFLNEEKLGMNPKDVFTLEVHWKGVKVEELKNELQNSTSVAKVTTTSYGAGLVNWNQTAYWPGSTEDERINMFVHNVDKDFFETLEIDLLEGAEKLESHNRTNKTFYLLNESAKEHIGWDKVQGEAFSVFGSQNYGEVLGVFRNFKFRSLHHKEEPSAFILRNSVVKNKMLIKSKPGKKAETIDAIKEKWADFAPPNAPFLLSSMENDFENLYEAESRTKKIVTYFTIVALIISFVGLLGLATYISLQRTKEIGVRKVMGSTEGGIIKMLVSSFLKWVILSFVIAAPLAYIYMNNWLQNFAYHTEIGVTVFLHAGLFALGVGFFSVIFQAYRAALTNPVDSLRYE
ncbi:MAG: ABC transporter permease [Bacteroidales bacterium]